MTHNWQLMITYLLHFRAGHLSNCVPYLKVWLAVRGSDGLVDTLARVILIRVCNKRGHGIISTISTQYHLQIFYNIYTVWGNLGEGAIYNVYLVTGSVCHYSCQVLLGTYLNTGKVSMCMYVYLFQVKRSLTSVPLPGVPDCPGPAGLVPGARPRHLGPPPAGAADRAPDTREIMYTE